MEFRFLTRNLISFLSNFSYFKFYFPRWYSLGSISLTQKNSFKMTLQSPCKEFEDAFIRKKMVICMRIESQKNIQKHYTIRVNKNRIFAFPYASFLTAQPGRDQKRKGRTYW